MLAAPDWPWHTMKPQQLAASSFLRWAAALICLCCAVVAQASAGSFELPMMHRFSQEFRELARGRPEWAPFMAALEDLPPPGSAEFYHILAMQDRHRHVAHGHRRSLLAANSSEVYSLYPSNETFYISALGQISYTLIELGSPAKEFLVALDTGSDLLWVPCDCQQCSDPNWATYGLDLKIGFATYSTTNSTTSKAVPCSSAICDGTLSPKNCSAGVACTYNSTYMSSNTTSSGTIVQDVVYLNPESKTGANVTADIYFGCGSVQTGSFLSGGAPDGLFGLGPEVYSVPRTLAASGVTEDVFSLCFSTSDSVGRLSFGKKPAPSSQSTPLVKVSPNVYYVLGIENIIAGGAVLNVSGSVVFDTGSSFTTLPSDIIKSVGDKLAASTNLTTFSFTFKNSLEFSYCWNATTESELENLASVSVTFGGGGVWDIADPLVLFAVNNVLGFACLGMLPSESRNSLPIIGYNFMSLYEYYFDLENSTFSWTFSDCSGYNGTGALAPSPASSPSLSPARSPLPSPSTTPSKSPSSSPKSSPGAARSPASNQSSAHRTTISRSIWIQVLLLTIFTSFLHSLVMQTS